MTTDTTNPPAASAPEVTTENQEPKTKPEKTEETNDKSPRNNYRRGRGGRNRGRGGRAPQQADRPNQGGRGRQVESPITYEGFQKMADHIKGRTEVRPKVAIICGSGLGPLAANIEKPDVLPYETIPGFPRSTVEGHAGELVFGELAGTPVVAMKGRFHPYEGYPLWKVVSPIRLFKVLGVTTIIVSNAAGGLNQDYKVGDIMIIKDHINFLGFANQSPLSGPNMDEFGARFPPISKAYDRALIKKAREVFKECNDGDDSFLREGVYIGLGGPTYETIAESRFLLNAGCDAVGMSTTQEVIAAAHCGLRVFGMSLITNAAIMDYDNEEEANHEEVLDTAKAREPVIMKFCAKFIEAIKDEL